MKKKWVGLLLAFMMVFSLCVNTFTAYAWNLSDIEEMPMEDPNAIADEPVVDEPEPVEDDFVIEKANEPEMTVEEDNQSEDLGDGLEISEEKVPEAVGEPGIFSLDTINTIAKDKDGNYYGVKTYENRNGNTDSFKIYYKITADQYNEVAKDCFMIFKRADGQAFAANVVKISTSYIDADDLGVETLAGPIFTEIQFRHHSAYDAGFLLNNSPLKVHGQEKLLWYIKLKKDWVVERDPKFYDDYGWCYAFVNFNVVMDGDGHKISRTDDQQKGILWAGFGTNGLGVEERTATIKNLTIDGSGKYYCIMVSEKGVLNLENVTIQNGYADKNNKYFGGAIRLDSEAKLTMDASTTIKDCKANMGGAIRLLGKNTLTINGSTLSNNQADLGGAICTTKGDCTINIAVATFDGNKAVTTITDEYLHGGAIYTNSPLNISATTFKNNFANKNGGAIMSYADATINGCEFNNNSSAEGNGGAIYQGEGKLTIDENTFTKNNAKKSGGAIYALENSTIKNSKYNENVAKWGGAIFNWDKLNISDVSFDGNIATADGGAIYTSDKKYASSINPATDYHNLDIDEKTTFTNNKASGYFNPPENVDKLTNIKSKVSSFTGTKKINPDSPLNNYDINYKRDIVVTYDPNDGNEVFEEKYQTQSIDNYEIKAVKDLNFTNTAKFLGWSEDKDSKNPEYQAGQKVNLTGNLYFYAIWEDTKPTPKPTPQEPNKYILTLDENYRGGEITDHEVEEGELIAPYLYIPRRRGYIFRGWSYDRKHLDEVKPEERIYSDTILYAIWKKAEIEKHEEPEEIRGEEHKAYIFGYPNGTVRPNGNITRAEAAAMLARLLNIEAIGSAAKPNFKDTESSWYNKAINAVVARGIMKGYPDGRFGPNAPITRAEFTQMISTIDNKPYGEAPFADVKGHWAERAIGSEYQAKRITGYPDGLFRPDANITRAEAAVILNKIFERNYDAMSLAKCKNALMLKRFIDLDETFWGYNDMVEATNTHEYVRRYKGMIEEDWLLIK